MEKSTINFEIKELSHLKKVQKGIEDDYSRVEYLKELSEIDIQKIYENTFSCEVIHDYKGISEESFKQILNMKLMGLH